MNGKILLSLLLASLILSCIPYPTFSASQDYKVLLFGETITVLNSRTAQISLHYKFMPLLREGYYYHTWYMYIDTKDAYGITVQNEYGPLPFNASLYDSWTKLVIDLRRRVYANQSYLLKISYLTGDKIETKGPEKNLRVWTVTDSVYKENVTLTVNIPKSFGVVKYEVKDEPLFLSSREGADSTVLSGQRLGVGSDKQYYLSVEFAETVVQYDIAYKYTFVNHGSATESTPEFEVPGPGTLESERQEVLQISYDPSPISTSYDESGNLRAKFSTSPVASGGNVAITIRFMAKITLPPAISDSYIGGLGEIPPDLEKYTTADKYWEVNDSTIRSLSQSLTKSETSVLNKVKAIYNYVIDNIKYDDAKFQAILSGQNTVRYGAVKTLALGKGVCQDISDLFVTVCRASGIPAVEVCGPTYSRDGVISYAESSHAWNEVYIPGYGWLQVDPTWKLFGRLEGRHIVELLEKDSSEPKYVWWWVYQPFSYEEKYDITYVSLKTSSISCSVSSSSLTIGGSVIVSGSITPARPSVTVTLSYESDGSWSTLATVTSASNGSYSYSWKPTSAGSYQLIGSWAGDSTYSGATSNATSVTVNKITTTISCSASPTSLSIGSSIAVNGSMTPVRSGVPVTLSYTMPNSSVITRTVTSTSDGRFSDKYAPPVLGSWSVKASSEGDQTYAEATSSSVSFTVSKISTTMSCSVSPSEVTEGDSVTVSGSISPRVMGKTVTLSFKKPDGSTLTRTATTGSDGSYSDSYKTDVVGSSSVSASWDGDSEHQSASSQSASFNVKKKGCIIATATYGSELSPQVQFLRGFRDNMVLKTFAGSSFMAVFDAWYYSFSPTVASTISGNEVLRGAMKGVLYPLIGILHLSSLTFSLFSFNSELGVVIAGFIASSLIAVVYFMPWALLLSFLRKFRISTKIIHLTGLIWAGSVVAMAVAEVAASSPLMMAATGAFVLTTMCLTTLAVTRVVTEV